MKANFDLFLTEVLKHEGGYVDHPKDPGGATNLGVTIGTLSSWLGRPATKAEVRALTVKDVAPIYKKNYWDRIRGDDLPSGVDTATGDFAVNSGVSRAAIYLQETVGVAADGRIGPLTLAAVAKADPVKVVNVLCDKRMAFLRRLSTFPTFGRGWTSRVTGVRAVALRLAGAAPKPIPVSGVGDDAGKPLNGAGPATAVGALVVAAGTAVYLWLKSIGVPLP